MKSKWNYPTMVLLVLFTGWLAAQAPVPAIWRTGEPDLHAPGDERATETVTTRNGITVFTVYTEEGTEREVPLWTLNQGGEEHYRLSTRRWVDHPSGTGRYFTGLGPGLPRLMTSVIGNVPGRENHWELVAGGAEMEDNDKAVSIVELQVFDRVLDPTEVIKVETYLSLKYGLSLVNENDLLLLAGQGDTLWYAGQQDDYRYRVAGIGHDPEWPLYRGVGCGAYDADLITFRSADSLAKDAFLLWGDNGQTLELAAGPAGLVTTKRQWRLDGTNAVGITADVLIGTGWAGELQENERVWMVIDPNPGAHFSLEDLVFLPSPQTHDGLAIVRLKDWSNFGDEDCYFTFAKAPEFFSAWETLAEEDCQHFSLNWRAVGGTPPYSYKLVNEQGDVTALNQGLGDEMRSNGDLPLGNYVLEVTDGNGRKLLQRITSPARCRPASDLSPLLPSQLVLSTELRNNPSRNGAFELDLELTEPSAIQLSVVDVLGRTVHSEHRLPATRHAFNGVAGLSAGWYRLVLRVGGEVYSLSLVNH